MALTFLGCALAPQPAAATTWSVGKCGDMAGKGGDTLRIAIGKAGTNDTVDLSSLPVTCSTITLTGGQIPIAVSNLTIQTPIDRPVTVDAAHAGRVFDHTGSGLLNVFGLVLANGSAGVGDSTGGCVRSSGSVLLQYATVTGCEAAVGGGVIASNLSLIHSTISGCSIHYEVGGSTAGAAAWAWGSTLLSYATITDNYSQLSGAGLYSVGSITVNRSSISGNTANFSTGYFKDGPTPGFLGRCTALNTVAGTATITASTIDGNLAADPGTLPGSLRSAVCAGAVTIDSSTFSRNSGYAITVRSSASLRNTTISSNDAGLLFFSMSSLNVFSSTFAFNASSLRLLPASGCSIWIESTIMADNSIPISFCSQNTNIQNLVGSPVEAGLTPLAWRGGPTKTHGLMIGSPAINAGSNPATQSFDQRGTGYARFVASAPDIGAYERQADDDELFYGGFD